MALYSEFRPTLGEIAKYLRHIAGSSSCRSVTPSAGTTSPIPAGFNNLVITASAATTLTFPDSSTYVMAVNEVVRLEGGTLPQITAAGTFKWYGIK